MGEELAANPTISHYRVLSKLGEGGMGEVWLAEDTRLDRKVAIKLLPAEFTQDTQRLRRFTQEAKAASALNHPNIISVYDIGESESGRFIVMEFVVGRTLRSVIAADNSIQTLFTLGRQMARALSAAHAAGITHRDIKPDNIMVRDDGYVKMLDFGLARLLPTTSSDPEAMTLAQQTTPGTVMGTLAYMSPEQASGQTVGSPSDVFALGIVLYELATGHHPFKSETMIGYLHAITLQAPPFMTSIKSDLPPALDDLILRMLEKDARQRPTASEVAQALQEIEKYGSSNTLPIRVAADKPKVTREGEGFLVAVLPFKSSGAAAELKALAEGLSEEIVTGLSRFSYLRVISHRDAGQSSDVKMLGARYVMEGSLRQSGIRLRLAVQLVDTTTGTHLWAETYDRPFSSEDIFALQDDLAPRIVSTVADQYGALVHSMSESLRGKSADQYSAHEAAMRTFGYWERMTAEEHAEVRDILEAAVATAPDHSDCLAELSMIYWHEHAFGYNPRPDPIGRARDAAQRAVAAAPSSHFAHCALATSLFFQKDFLAFRPAAERALALNRMDASTMELLGQMIAYAGDWEYGLSVVERAMQLNPHHPGWYHYLTFCDKYRKHDYHGALASALKVNMPAYHWPHVYLAAVYGQLGEQQRANEALRQLHALIPSFGAIAREEMGKWLDPELTEHLLDGLRKAGLTIADEDRPADASSALHSSGEKRADEGFWVVVLPFKATGTNADLSTLAEGLSDEIVTGLNRFSYLRVIARSSTLRYASETSDVRTIGKTLGARYVMEGGVRQAGSVLRVTVQLIDAHTGANLWAETYDRPFRSEDIFALQDDLVPRIVSTVADQHGVLPHTMSEVLRFRDPDTLRPHEVVLRVFGYHERGNAAEHAALRSALERAVEEAPGSADCWAMLAIMYCDEHKFGFNPLPDSLGRARASAQRAVEASASNPFAYEALAQALFFRREFNAFRNAAERAIALNPLDGATTAFMGMLMACTGDWEHGCAVAERATQLNPHHPGWYWGAAVWNAYRKGDYSDALGFALKFNMPGFFHHHLNLAATHGQLGEREAASKALRDLLALMPDFAANARDELGKFFEPELVEHMIDGLRKAGLEIASEEEEAHHGSSEKRAGLPGTSDQNSSAITKSGLTSASSSSGSFSRPTIVVLPFVNRSPDADNEYFSDGLTEEIISDLSVIKALRVISRNSAMSFKGTSKDTFSIGKDLAVSHVVSGSVRKAGDDLRITVELVEVAGDTPLWSDKFSGTIANIFGFQEEISRKIVNALQLRLTEAEAEIIAERPIDNAAAYDCYLRARHEIYLFTAEGLDRAQKLVDSGLSLIGENSLLLATRGMVSWYYVNFSIRPEVKYLDEAAAYASKSLEQDPQNCFGIFLRGLVAAKRGDFESALRDLRTAHEQRPGDSMILNELIRHLSSSGQELNESSRPMFEESLRLDPLHPLNWAQAVWRHFNAGRLAEAIEAARRIFQLTDRGNPARVYGAYYLAIANLREEALNVFDAEGAALAGTAYGSLSLFLSRALRGDAEGAVKHVTPELEQAASWTEYLALFLADGYSLIGHHDASLKWLRAAVAQGFINYPYLAKCDPLLVSVRSDPRFAELMREVKPRWQALSPSNKLSDELQFVDSATGGSPETKDDQFQSVGPSVGHSSSIAVLPFVNISNDVENEYFCDGLAEELLNALSKIEALRVAARTSAFSFKGKDVDVREIGRKLNVGAVLEGSVRKSRDRLRISAQLVNVADGYHLWSEQYDRQLEDIFDIQDEISLAIVEALKVKLLGAQKAAVLKRHTDNTEAYQLYLKGRFFVNQRTSQSLHKAIECFNQAIAVDPNYALGYAGLTDAYMVLGVPDAVTEALTPLESLSKARAAGEKALQLDDSVAEIYPSLAHIKFKERDWVGAESDYKRGIELNPNYPIAHFYYAVFLASLGRHDEAVKEINLAHELDPLSLPVNASITYVLFFARRYDEAIAAGKRNLELDAAFSLTHQRLGLPYVQKMMYREAIAEFEQAAKNSNRAPQPLISLAHAYAVSGNADEAERVLVELKEMSQSRYVSPYGIATIHLGMGDKEQAFQWLDKALDEQNTELTFLKVDPRLDPLRDEPRFQELIEKAGFPE